MNRQLIEKLLRTKQRLVADLESPSTVKKEAEEGGCGVVGFCCSEPVAGRHIHEPSKQMHNRGNGKGGGIAAVGFVPEELGVTREVLDECYMLHIALLDPEVRKEVEDEFITPYFDVSASAALETVDNWEDVPGLEVKPPDVHRYFVRVKPDVLDTFIKAGELEALDRRAAEEEFINQNSFRLNQKHYASLGDKRAFVMSHGRNIMILKVVGYAEAITQYYKIEDLRAHVWIAHQRYPTKGRVWHPAGAHPFAAINMALVHNGDFANYHSVSEHLKQRHIYPQFLTDTEVSALLFDLLDRTYNYPLEYIIEAMAPTTERDFDQLSPEKQRVYRAVQATHIHGSPDGPWFFIIARNIPTDDKFQLLGITDTAMLRPQVFALCEGEVQVGLIASEKQAIDATLQSLSKDDPRICPVADRYWNARGGSHTDGGSFRFDLAKNESGKIRITCSDKFGRGVRMPSGLEPCDFTAGASTADAAQGAAKAIEQHVTTGKAVNLYEYMRDNIPAWSFKELRGALECIVKHAAEPADTGRVIEALTLLNDRRYPTGDKKRSHIIHLVREALWTVFSSVPRLDKSARGAHRFIDWDSRATLREPQGDETTLIIDASGFAAEGNDCDAILLVDAYMKGWEQFIVFNCRGQRYIGCGLGPETDDVTIDVYGSNGDYLASGIDGLTIRVHGNAQDQLAQIIKRGKLVIYGDTGQTFMYGAKGGEVYVLGNAAGRPMINSVGRPKAIINGTCLDFLAESFMAGDPLTGGGFAIVNGVAFDDNGNIEPLAEPYPGSNLFSLASGGAIYVRDPQRQVDDQQLNGGEFAELTDEDWDLILPYLEENERLFNIKVQDLLTVDGELCKPTQVYRKVRPQTKTTVVKEAPATDDAMFAAVSEEDE